MSTQDDRDVPVIEPLSEDSGLCGGPGQLSCSEANELIQFYVDRLTDRDSGERVAEHLGDCPPCEFELVVYQRIIASLERCRPHVPPDTAERLHRFCSELPAVASDPNLQLDD
jgi:hypothetical protein